MGSWELPTHQVPLLQLVPERVKKGYECSTGGPSCTTHLPFKGPGWYEPKIWDLFPEVRLIVLQAFKKQVCSQETQLNGHHKMNIREWVPSVKLTVPPVLQLRLGSSPSAYHCMRQFKEVPNLSSGGWEISLCPVPSSSLNRQVWLEMADCSSSPTEHVKHLFKPTCALGMGKCLLSLAAHTGHTELVHMKWGIGKYGLSSIALTHLKSLHTGSLATFQVHAGPYTAVTQINRDP